MQRLDSGGARDATNQHGTSPRPNLGRRLRFRRRGVNPLAPLTVLTGAAGTPSASPRPLAVWAEEQLLTRLAAVGRWMVRDYSTGSGYLSTGPYHADRVFRTWR
jgi:hypothetical protein